MANSRARRQSDRERKRAEREVLRERGAPEPGLLDRVLVNALRNSVLLGLGHDDRPEDVVNASVRYRDILRLARAEFAKRGLNRNECDRAMVARLAPLDGTAPKAVTKPTPVAQEILIKEGVEPDADEDVMQKMLEDLAWDNGPTEHEDA